MIQFTSIKMIGHAYGRMHVHLKIIDRVIVLEEIHMYELAQSQAS